MNPTFRHLSVARWLAGLLALLALSAHAQIPQKIAYQGYLTTSAGQPVNASLSMTFGLYTAESGGPALWSETQVVPVSNGTYSVLLGSVTPLTIAFDVPYYLGVAVGGDPEMTPRRPLASAPYAIRAGCNPGDRITCFTGAGEPGSGCATGVRTCNAQGTGFGACVGEVTPNCDGNCVNFQTDLANCGACNNACPGVANGNPACTSGLCGIGSCNPGFANCDNNAATGCEVDTNTSLVNCGGCGVVCSPVANGTTACNSGSCGIGACNAGFANCDGNATNGCEANTNTSVNNCGGCGVVCSFANASPSCQSGVCALAACNAGFLSCDGNPANGCEINAQADVNNCGACGNACPPLANAVPGCLSGTCGLGACNSGFANCDGNPANGCEINTRSDVNNCGACGLTCAPGFSCSLGKCQP